MSVCIEQSNLINNQVSHRFSDSERSIFYAHFEHNKKNFFQLFQIWVNRSRQRKGLAKLDERMLADIGYTKEQVKVESSKPFWK